jgi:hypothetical protein
MSDINPKNDAMPSQPNLLTKVIAIYSSPKQLFGYIKNAPEWLVPVALTLIFSIITVITTVDLQYIAGEKAIMENSLIPEEVKDQAIEDLHNRPPMIMMLQSGLGGLLGVVIYFLFLALIFRVTGNFILGGEASFKQVFAMTAWGAMPGIVETIIKVPLMLSKGSMEVFTSPAILLDSAESKTLVYQILAGFDIFTIWKLVLWAIGFRVLYQLNKEKSYAVMAVLFVIYLVISIGFSQLLQGFTG